MARTLKLKVRNNPRRTICSQVEETFKVIRRAIVPFQFQDVAIAEQLAIAEQVAISGVNYQTYENIRYIFFVMRSGQFLFDKTRKNSVMRSKLLLNQFKYTEDYTQNNCALGCFSIGVYKGPCESFETFRRGNYNCPRLVEF